MRARNVWQAGLIVALALLYPPSAQPQMPSEAQERQARGDWKGAEETWRQVLKTNADDYRVWASLGIVLAQEHRYKEAVAAYRKALALQPEDGQTELNLGIAYFKMGRLAEATKPLELAARSLGNNPRLDVLLGMSLYGNARYKAALPYLERACSEQPGNAELQRALGETYLHSGAYDKALAAFKNVLTQNPDSATAHLLLGEAYDAANREEAAITEFRSATQGGYVPNAHFGLGYLLWKAHSYDEAAAEFQKELDGDSQNSQALAYLGDVALKKGDKARAGTLLRRSIALRGDDHLAFVDLGTIETGSKQYNLAEQHLKHAISLNPQDADAHYRLARLYQLTGRTDKAGAEFALVKQVHQRDTDDMVFKVSHDRPLPATSPTALR